MKKIFIDNQISEKNLLYKILKTGNVEIVKYNNINEIIDEDYVITNDTNLINRFNVLLYNDLVNEILKFYFDSYIKDYDYNFLCNSIKLARKVNVDNLIVGSSYSRKGIEEKFLSKETINLSLSSQDLYYACLLAKDIILNNDGIKNVFIGTGYYTFHHDISRSTGLELNMVYNLYNPLVKDVHNAKSTENYYKNINYYDKYSDVLDEEECYEVFNDFIFKEFGCRYYNNLINRENTKINIGEEIKWSEIPEVRREKHCIDRTNHHNKFINYKESFEENIDILNVFVQFCNKRNINVVVITFPFSKYYLENIDFNLKVKFVEALNKVGGNLNYIDFNEINIFNENDFLDMDHLNLNGAKKLTSILSNMEF